MDDMAKMEAVPAAEFTRNFGRYRMLAQKGAVPVTSYGQRNFPASKYDCRPSFSGNVYEFRDPLPCAEV